VDLGYERGQAGAYRVARSWLEVAAAVLCRCAGQQEIKGSGGTQETIFLFVTVASIVLERREGSGLGRQTPPELETTEDRDQQNENVLLIP
jgi:hypothetical protein